MITNHLNTTHFLQLNGQGALPSIDAPKVQAILKKAGINLNQNKNYDKIIKSECKQRIKELKDLNKEILPKKLRQGRITLLGVASLIGTVAGAVLGVIGIGLCFTGVGLPAGLALLGTGAVLMAIGIPCLRYFNKKVNQEKAVKKNNEQILILKKIIKEPDFKKFVVNLKDELAIVHLSAPAFALRYDFKKLYHLHTLHEQEMLKKFRKRDPENRSYFDYSTDLNVIAEKIAVTNKILQEMDLIIKKINRAIIKNSKKGSGDIPVLNGCRKVFLGRAKYLLRARAEILEKAPIENKLSFEARRRLVYLKRAAKQPFAILNASLKNR